MDRTCRNCKYEHLEDFANPCKSCYSFKKWEPKDGAKRCGTCRYETRFANEAPCGSCTNAWFSGDACNWEPKEQEDDMENENTTTKIDTEAELKMQVAKLQEELEQAKEKNEDQRHVIDGLNSELARKTGMVEGLKFAIRCNGVSGGEV